MTLSNGRSYKTRRQGGLLELSVSSKDFKALKLPVELPQLNSAQAALADELKNTLTKIIKLNTLGSVIISRMGPSECFQEQQSYDHVITGFNRLDWQI